LFITHLDQCASQPSYIFLPETLTLVCVHTPTTPHYRGSPKRQKENYHNDTSRPHCVYGAQSLLRIYEEGHLHCEYDIWRNVNFLFLNTLCLFTPLAMDNDKTLVPPTTYGRSTSPNVIVTRNLIVRPGVSLQPHRFPNVSNLHRGSDPTLGERLLRRQDRRHSSSDGKDCEGTSVVMEYDCHIK
jgi:hypothetical protein